jgi:putative cardiolipin synthase
VYWGQAHVLYDQPHKMLADSFTESDALSAGLRPYLLEAESDLILVSPYFIPGAEGTNELVRLVDQGLNVSITTNSLAATDVPMVHSAYARYRKTLLEGGVEVLETRPDQLERLRLRDKKLGNDARASLHAKTLMIDQNKVFVGSFNLDPRSSAINTEMGILLHNAALGQRMLAWYQGAAREHVYEVRLDSRDRMYWLERDGASGQQAVRWDVEPHTGPLQRALTWLMGFLPIEPLL